MDVTKNLASRFADSGHQEITVTETSIDPSKGAIKCSISGGGNIRLPRIAEAGHLPFFLTATDAGNQVILNSIEDGGVTTVTTLASGGTAEAIVWYDGYAWRSINMTNYAGSALLGTLLSRNDSTGVQTITGTANVTKLKQVITLAGTGTYTVTLPPVADTEAMPYFFVMLAATNLVVTINNSAGVAVGTLTAGKEVAGIVVSDGTAVQTNYLIPIPLNSVCGPTSATTNDIALFDGTSGKLLKGGIAPETTLSPASDILIPTSKAVAVYAEPIPAAAVSGNLASFDASKHVVDSGVAATTVTDLEAWCKNHVVQGGKGADGTTPSTHADAGPFDYNADLSEVVAIVDNVYGTVAAAGDIDLAHGAGAAPIDGTTTDIYYTVYLWNNAGTLTIAVIAGAAATSGNAVAPTDVAIAAVHDPFVRICDIKVVRTGAATCSVTVYDDVKPVV